MPKIDPLRAIKDRIKKLITEDQIMAFRRFKRRIGSAKQRLLAFSVRLIPLKARLFIKTHTQLIEKMDYDRSDIYLDVDSPIEYRTRLRSCAKEAETVTWISKFFKHGDIFFDVGANVGAYSLVASKIHDGSITVYAFEPAFPTFYKLCRNILINRCGDRVVPMQVALSDRTDMERFYYSDMAPGAAMHLLGSAKDAADGSFKAAYSQPVVSFRMDDLISQFNLPCPGHIKIDVDGSELKVIRGAAKTLANPSVRTLLLELNEANVAEAAEIKELLLSKGFTVYAKHRTGLCATGEVFNYIFSKE